MCPWGPSARSSTLPPLIHQCLHQGPSLQMINPQAFFLKAPRGFQEIREYFSSSVPLGGTCVPRQHSMLSDSPCEKLGLGSSVSAGHSLPSRCNACRCGVGRPDEKRNTWKLRVEMWPLASRPYRTHGHTVHTATPSTPPMLSAPSAPFTPPTSSTPLMRSTLSHHSHHPCCPHCLHHLHCLHQSHPPRPPHRPLCLHHSHHLHRRTVYTTRTATGQLFNPCLWENSFRFAHI